MRAADVRTSHYLCPGWKGFESFGRLSRRRRDSRNFVECPCVANDQSGMDWVKAFALENGDVVVGHMIQRCHRIETHQSELLGDGVSISRNALDGEVPEPCEDEGRL